MKARFRMLLLGAIVVSGFTLFSSPVETFAAPARVQAVSKNCNTAVNCTVSISPVQSGNLLIVTSLVRNDEDQSAPSVTDSQGNAFTSVYHQSAGGHYSNDMWYVSNVTNAPTSVTIAIPSDGQSVTMVVAEYSGIESSSPLDGASNPGNPVSTAASYASQAITTTNANDLLIGTTVNNSNSNQTFTGAGGWNSFVTQNDLPSGNTVGMQDQIGSLAGSYQNTGTASAGSNIGVAVVAFKAASTAGGGGSPVPPVTPPASDTTAPALSSISSGSIAQMSAAISWNSDESSDSQVEYGLTTSYGNSTTLNSSMMTSHSVSLSPLTANTLYHYRVKSKDAAGNVAVSMDNSFTTQASVVAPPPSGLRTFYVDYASGSDSNNGTSKAAPWKRAPGMKNFAGAYSHQAGDDFIFKGGVTWPAVNFPMAIAAGGSSAAGNDYYGVDQSWYAGGSWTRPVFDGEYTASSLIMFASSLNYITIDNLELKRINAATNFGPGLISAFNPQNVLLDHLYLHGWRTSASTDDAHGGVIFVYSGLATWSNVVLQNSTVENSENTGNGTQNGVALRQVQTIRSSTIHDVSSAVLFTADFHDNSVYNVDYPAGNNGFDPAYHTNTLYLDSTGSATTYVYGNFIRDWGNGASGVYPNPHGNQTMYIYGNVLYGSMSDQQAIELDTYNYGSGNGGNVYVYGNTIVNFKSSWNAVHVVAGGTNRPPVNTLVIKNNHIIGTSAGVVDATQGVGAITLTSSNNLVQTPAAAAAQGYALANKYAPTASSNPTIDAGTSISCGSCLDFNKDVLDASRPQGSAWDIGAYEYAGSGGSTPPVTPPASDTTAPIVSVMLPVNGSAVSSSVSLAASASDNVGVIGVQFKLDGSNLGSELTTSPYSGSWNTIGVSNGSHTLTAVARDAAGNMKTSSSVTVTVSNVTADTSPPSAPAGLTSSSVTQTGITLSWLAAVDNVGVAGYKIFRNGTQIASPTTNSYAVTGLSANTTYTFTVSAYDAAGNTSSLSLPLSVTTASIPVTTFLLSASKTGNGVITGNGLNCGSTCSVSITNGTTVTLTATPTSDSTFSGWSGACSNTTGTCVTTVTGAKSVSASFTLIIPVSAPVTPPTTGGGSSGGGSSSGGGTVVSSPTGVFTPTVPQGGAGTLPGITPAPTTGAGLPGIILTKNLYVGITDPEVMTLQKYLALQGYLTASPTGYFGLMTEAAVKKYQAIKGITQTGTAGPVTRASLAGGSVIITVPITSTTIPAFTRSLTIGTTGTDVKYLQIFLNKHGFQVSLSGAGSPNNETTTFGPATQRALAKFQAAKGISPAAGYFGPKTMLVINQQR